MSVRPAAPPAAWDELAPAPAPDSPARKLRRLGSRVVTMCLVEVQKLRRDRVEVLTRAVQPALWLVIFGETFNRLRVIPSGDVPYLDYLTPGILAQSALFVAIFYGIQVIWERDAGVLAKLMATPTPRSALVTGKAFAAGLRGLVQAAVVVVLGALLGVQLHADPLRLLAVAGLVLLGSSFFCSLSITIAGLVLSREQLMGIGQLIMMPLFFASNALYPVAVMPAWLRAVDRVNPLSYEIDALRGVLLGTPANLVLDVGVLAGASALAIAVASALLPRLAR